MKTARCKSKPFFHICMSFYISGQKPNGRPVSAGYLTYFNSLLCNCWACLKWHGWLAGMASNNSDKDRRQIGYL